MITKKAREWDEIRARLAERSNPPPLNIPAGVTIRHSHGRYYATNGTRFAGWSLSEKGALDKWTQQNDG